MTAGRHQPRKPTVVGPPWSLLFIPVLLIGGALSIPYVLVAGRLRQRRERALRAEMAALGRIIGWSDFVRTISENRGTTIEERSSLKGPTRWWWTSENVYDECPYPTADWLTMSKDESFRPAAEWFWQRYTSPVQGRALLVAADEAEREEARCAWSDFRSELGTARWIEIAPPKRL